MDAKDHVTTQRGSGVDWGMEEIGDEEREIVEDTRSALEALKDTVSVLAQSRSRANWKALGHFLLHTPKAAIAAAEEHLGFDSQDSSFGWSEKFQVDAFYGAVLALLDALPAETTTEAKKACKRITFAFLAGVPAGVC